MARTNIAALASALQAFAACRKAPVNQFGVDLHGRTIAQCMACAPHGSGLDANVTLDDERSNEKRIVIHADVHLMNEHGYYCGWRVATVTIRPTFSGIDVDVTGKGLDEAWKDDIAERFSCWASETFVNNDKAEA